MSTDCPISAHCSKPRNQKDSGNTLLKDGGRTLTQAPNHLQPSSEVTGPADRVLELPRILAVPEGSGGGGRRGREGTRSDTRPPRLPLANNEKLMVGRAEAREEVPVTERSEWQSG